VKLKKSGREFKGLCPFHQEKQPFFYVNPEKRFYFCHGCRATGDAIRFVMRMEGKPFVDAVHLLAQAGKVAIPGASSDEEVYRQRLLHVTRVASQFFSEQLWLASPDSLAWRALTRRGLQQGTLRSFGIGLAPPSWNALSSVLHGKCSPCPVVRPRTPHCARRTCR
jgi:DNA primase